MKSKFNFYLKQSLRYNYFQSLLSKLISFTSSILLARIFFVEDFGYILIAYTISSAINVFSNVGLTSYYYQKNLKNELEGQKILATTLLISAGLFFIVFCLKIGVSIFIKYNYNEIIGNLLFIQSFCVLLTIPNSIHSVRLQKNINFKSLSFANLTKDLSASLMKCILAISGLGPISVAYGELIGRFFKFLYFKIADQKLPSIMEIDKDKIYVIIFFGKHGFLTGFFSYLNQQMDKMYFSFTFSPLQLGYFNFGVQNGGIISQVFLVPQRKLLSSYLIEIKKDIEFLKMKLFSLSRLSNYIFLFFSFLFFLNSELFIKILFGNKWIESIGFLKLFIISETISTLFFFSNSLLLVFGFPQIISKIKMIKLPFFFFLLLISYLLKLNFYETAVIYVAGNILMTFLQQIISFKKVKISIFDYYKNLTPIILNFTFGLLVSLLIGKFIKGNIGLLFQNLSFCFIYIATGVLFLKGKLKSDYYLIKYNESFKL